MPDFIDTLFDTDGFPARWHCGNWTDPHGWVHVCSDVAIFAAYMCIPAVLTYFVIRRTNVPLSPIFWWFGAFIAFCGFGHLLEAVIFWHPVYRLAGLNKLCTAVVSWGTVLVLVPAARHAMQWRSPAELEAEIVKQTALFRDLYDGAPDMYVSVDAKSRRISQCNATLVQRLGYSQETLVGMRVMDLYDSSCRPDAQAAFEQFLKTGIVQNAELILRTNGGEKIDVSLNVAAVRDEQGRITGSRSALRDITATKRAEALFELAVEASPNPIFVTSAEGTIELANAACEMVFGYSREELVGESIDTLIPESLPAVDGEPQDGTDRPKAQAMGEGRAQSVKRKNGSTFPAQVGFNPIETPDGTLVLCAVVDLTELVSKQRDLERSNAELEQFAYVASHDLQEPLRMVASYVALLEKRYRGRLDEGADKYIAYAVDGAMRMQAMLRDILQMSRLGSDTRAFESVSLEDVIEEATKSLALDQSDATVSVGALPTVQGDRAQLTRLFQNLLSNAVKFRGEEPPRIEISAAPTSEGWEVRVRDHGIGFDQKHAGRIFEVFQRLNARDEYSGTGIGLAIVRKIVQHHGGRVWAEAQAGEGAMFCFTLSRGELDS